jgi:tetratricopeptide (TPR) repeat protein
MSVRVLQLGLIALPALAALVLAAPAGQISPERQRQILRDALNAFDDAVAAAERDPAHAAELYRQAAASFEALLETGLHNAGLEYNLGNTCFRLGRLGEALVHYRRAERLDPGRESLRANLAYARRQVEPYLEPSGQDRLWHRLLFRTPLSLRYHAAPALAGLGWILLLLRLRWNARPLLAAGVVSALLGLACAASVNWQMYDEARYPSAVVVTGDQTLRLGRGEGYEPAIKQPLGPGVELRVLQQRADWVEVQLGNGQTGWLPAAAIERI